MMGLIFLCGSGLCSLLGIRSVIASVLEAYRGQDWTCSLLQGVLTLFLCFWIVFIVSQ